MGAVLTTAVTLSACSTPPHAVVSRCQGGYSERSCTITIERFEKPTSASFESSSSNRGLDLQGSFTIRSGTARIQVRGGDGTAAEHTLTPDQPVELAVSTRFNRGTKDQDNFFVVHFEPDGVAEGVSGSLTYQAVSQNR